MVRSQRDPFYNHPDAGEGWVERGDGVKGQSAPERRHYHRKDLLHVIFVEIKPRSDSKGARTLTPRTRYVTWIGYD